MSAFLERLRRIFSGKEEGGHHHRQTDRNLGYGGLLLKRIRSVFGPLPTYHHHQEQESSQSLTFALPSLSPLRVHVVVHNPLTGDLIGLQNEPKFGTIVDELIMARLSQSSHHQEQELSQSLAFAPPSLSPLCVHLLVHNPLTGESVGLPNELKFGRTVGELIMTRLSQYSHHQEQELSQSLIFTPPSLSPLCVHLVVHNPLTGDLIRLQNELKFGMTVDELILSRLSQSSHNQEQELLQSLTFTTPSLLPPHVQLVVHNPLTGDLIGLQNEPKFGMTVDKLIMAGLSQHSHHQEQELSQSLTFAPPSLSPLRVHLVVHNPLTGDLIGLQYELKFGMTADELIMAMLSQSSHHQEQELSQSFTLAPPSLSPLCVHLVVHNPLTGDLIQLQNEPKFSMTADELIMARLSQSSHHQEQELSQSLTFAPPSLLPLGVHPVVNNPLTRDLIGLQNEPKFAMTVCALIMARLSQYSNGTSPSASVKPSHFASKAFIVSFSDPFVSPAKRPLISSPLKQYLAQSPQPWSELSSSHLQCPLSETSLPTPKVEQHSSQSAKECEPVFSAAIFQANPTSVSIYSNKYVPKSETSQSLPSNTNEPSPLKFTLPSSSSTRHVVVHNPMTRDPTRPKSELKLSRSVSDLTQSSHGTSPFNAVPSGSPKPSPSVSKPSTITSSNPFVSPAKPAALSALPAVSETIPPSISSHSNQNVAKPPWPSDELSSSRVQSPSSSTTTSPTPKAQKLSAEQFKWDVPPVVLETKHPRPSDELSSSHVQSPSSSKTNSCTPKALEHSAKQNKPVLRAVSSVWPNQRKKTVYVQKDTSPIYSIPEDVEDLIKRDIVPGVLQKPLSPSTYRDYFAALLYAEDFYIEKWTEFVMKDVTLELDQSTIYKNERNYDCFSEENCVTFVQFKMESVPAHRPFLLSRDFVFAKPLDKKDTQYQGFVCKVKKGSIVLAEFGDDFHSQHHSSSRYNISFSFNRVCLKRARQAVEATSDPSFRNFLFPICATRRDLFALPSLFFSEDVLYSEQRSAIRQILTLKGSAPFLMEGPLCTRDLHLSMAGVVVREAVSQVYQRCKDPRILVAAPINKTCDILMRSLMKEIPDSEIFRANAAFREKDGVPIDILPSCLYEKESKCFACPPLQELQRFKVIFSTFVSSFRLHNEGINAGHFSHIFLVDASSTSEPEAMIVLANLANEDTTVVVTGVQGNRSGRVRSPIAQKNGLQISYFERLRELTPYKNLDPAFIAQVAAEPERMNSAWPHFDCQLLYA
ncbi:uncharacterized protein LOC104421620 [Eucalyptus grandis]|uniref:uncharacterized protein LOC104421620 n=1 Tax=Eucalyptus grandis TaxID=71139 RepID=UPI00192E99AF|nr:uncharacterized protein LOC104421620 [Eucalyptus grandis]